MGRAQHQREAELVRVLPDAGGGAVLVVAGSAPMVWRVLGLRPGSVSGFDMEPLEGEQWGGPVAPPPGLVPPPLLIYPTFHALDCGALPLVDVLHVWCGSSTYGTRVNGFWLWQRQGLSLTPLSLLDVRGALASPWRQRVLGSAAVKDRGIILRS